MQTQLTDLTVKTLPPGTHWDTHTRGLGLRVGKQSRVFIVLVQSGKRKTIGRYPHLTLAAARKECARVKAEATLGKIHLRRTAFEDAVADFLKDCAVRPRTLKNYRDYLAFFPFHRKALGDITARDILNALQPHTQSQREHAHRVARTFFRWCVHQHLIDRNPMETMRPVPAGRPRARVLSEDELRAVWRTARASAGIFSRLVALLILTGQRRGELAQLEWSWVQSDTITLPSHVTKNGREHTFPIGPETAAVLASIPRLKDCPYVFPAARQRSAQTTVMNGWSKAKAQFDNACGVSGWTLHDLRRTYATGMQRLGVRLEVTERLLNHVSGSQAGIVGIYQRYDFMPEMRNAALKWEAYITTLT